MVKSEAARVFDVSLSSVKRYVGASREGGPLRSRKHPGSKPKIDEQGRRLLEAYVGARPTATLAERREYLQRVAGVRLLEPRVDLGGEGELKYRLETDALVADRFTLGLRRCTYVAK